MIAAVKRHPLVTFFLLAYCLSWASYYFMSGPVLFVFGPFLSALIVASVTRGREGLKDLLGNCLRWRVPLKWYAAAVLMAAAIGLATLSLNLLFGAQLPAASQLGHWYSLFLLFPGTLLDAPLWEETGWRGYAMPRFPDNRSPLVNSLILGVLLAGWHLPIALSGGPIATPYLLAAVASAVVTNWVYYNARRSALLAMLYHTTANTLSLYFFQMYWGSDVVRLYWLLAAVNWVAAAILVLVFGTKLRREPT